MASLVKPVLVRLDCIPCEALLLQQLRSARLALLVACRFASANAQCPWTTD